MALRLLFNFTKAVESVARLLAAVMMAAIMMIVVTDVFLRYAFNKPLAWAYDVVSLYLMGGVFFLILSDAYVQGAHVSVDILRPAMSCFIAVVTEFVILVVGFLIFLLMAVVGWHDFAASYQNNDVVAGAIPWPTWPAQALVPFGAALIALRLFLSICARIVAVVMGREVTDDAMVRNAHPGASE